jgi:general secretion pathway protein K
MTPMNSTRQRGVALLIVLWVLALVAVLLGGFVLLARTEQLEARHLADGAQARYAAEAGVSRAVYELMRPNPDTRWVADGRPYKITFEEIEVEVRVSDEGGKVDINAADEQTLAALFGLAGVEREQAARLTDAVLDWRDPDDLVRPNGAEKAEYEAAGLTYHPSNTGFATLGELQQVLGMDYELFRKLRPFVTVYSRSGRPNFGLAPMQLLQLLPGVTPELAQQLVEIRQHTLPGDPAAQALKLPDGTPLVAGGGSGTYTVQSLATLSNGMHSGLTAVIRLGGAPGARAYTALEWRLGNYE